MADWTTDFRRLPEDIQDQLSMISTKFNKNLSTVVQKFQEIYQTHYKIRKITDQHERYQRACVEVNKFYLLREVDTESWKKMVYETATDICKQYAFKTSMPNVNQPKRLYILLENYYQDIPAEDTIKNTAHETLGHQATKKTMNEVVSHVTELSLDKNVDCFARDRYLIALENGILDTKKIEIIDGFDDDKFITVKIPVRYDPNIDTTEWEEYIKQICAENYIPMLQEYTGFTLYRDYITKKALLIYGPPDSSKSTFLEIIRTFLGGSRNVSSIPLTDLDKNYNSAELYNKLANIVSDIDYHHPMKKPILFKMLTSGRDIITVRRIYEPPFQMISHAKIWYSANGIPIPPDTADDAYFKRWVHIPFPYRFEGDKDDKTIYDKFTSPDQMSAILKWALKGLKRLMRNNWIFTNQPTLEENKSFFESAIIVFDEDIQMFVDDCVVYDKKYAVDKKLLYEVYELWCEILEIPLYNDRIFFKKLYTVLSLKEAKDRLWQPLITADSTEKEKQVHALPKFKVDLFNVKIRRALYHMSKDEIINVINQKKHFPYILQIKNNTIDKLNIFLNRKEEKSINYTNFHKEENMEQQLINYDEKEEQDTQLEWD